MEDFLFFLQEYGFKIVGAFISMFTYIVAWRSGKKSGSSALLKDIKKLEAIERRNLKK